MNKLMFVCSQCGFIAFVERPFELQLAEWRAEIRADGTPVYTCTTCVADTVAAASDPREAHAPAPPPRTHTKAGV